MAADMDLIIERFGLARDSTLAEVLVDGFHECFGLEDERRKVKVPGETCIPEGRYEIKLRTEGGLHRRYLERFPSTHKGMLWLQDVPNFRWIYIHIGNDEGDTDGCPLVGKYPVVLPDGEFKVVESTKAYLALYKKVVAAITKGQRIFCTVRVREAA